MSCIWTPLNGTGDMRHVTHNTRHLIYYCFLLHIFIFICMVLLYVIRLREVGCLPYVGFFLFPSPYHPVSSSPKLLPFLLLASWGRGPQHFISRFSAPTYNHCPTIYSTPVTAMHCENFHSTGISAGLVYKFQCPSDCVT